jgi:hypothetical protein
MVLSEQEIRNLRQCYRDRLDDLVDPVTHRDYRVKIETLEEVLND